MHLCWYKLPALKLSPGHHLSLSCGSAIWCMVHSNISFQRFHQMLQPPRSLADVHNICHILYEPHTSVRIWKQALQLLILCNTATRRWCRWWWRPPSQIITMIPMVDMHLIHETGHTWSSALIFLHMNAASASLEWSYLLKTFGTVYN